jgi:hypothetical protein
VLRYHKTLLVWTTAVDKHKRLATVAKGTSKETPRKQATEGKLLMVKEALIEILTENKSGMSLA